MRTGGTYFGIIGKRGPVAIHRYQIQHYLTLVRENPGGFAIPTPMLPEKRPRLGED